MRALDRRFVLRRLLPAVAVLVLISSAALLANASGGEETGPLCQESAPNFDPAWPMDTLTDWVSYSDQLSIVRVKSEKALSPLEETDENGGLVGRSVDLEIERTLWHRDGSPSAAGTISMTVDPWMVDGSDANPWNISGGARLEVGGRYVLPLAQLKTENGKEWAKSGAESTFPLEGSTIVCGWVTDGGSPREDLAGSSVDDLAARFVEIEPTLSLEKYRGLDPIERWHAVSDGQ